MNLRTALLLSIAACFSFFSGAAFAQAVRTDGDIVLTPNGAICGAGTSLVANCSNNPFLSVGLWSTTTITPGTGYVPGDQITPSIPSATVNSLFAGNYAGATLFVANTTVTTAALVAGGTCTGSSVTMTGTTGTGGSGFFFTATAQCINGTVFGPVAVASGGVYTTNPTTLTNEPVTCSGCSGVTLSITMGVLNAVPNNPGSYSPATNGVTATQSSTTGIGTGWTGTVTFAIQAAYLLPSPYANLAVSPSVVYKAFLNQCAGYLACNSVTTGIELTAFGWNALTSDTSGSFNTAFGIEALGGNTTSGNNAAFGRDACRWQTGGGNTCLGDGAGVGVITTTTGINNVYVGGSAGVVSTTASQSTCVGQGSCNALTSGTHNSGVGYEALFAVTSGSNNTALGFQAGLDITSSSNTVIGSTAGKTITTGGNNTCLGYQACSTTLTTGGQNIIIGINADADAPASGTIGYFGVFGASTTPSISIAGTGTPSTATTTIHGSTMVMPDIANATAAQTGTLCWTAAGITYDNTNTCLMSSAKFKKDIHPLGDVTKIIMAMKPIKFRYRDEKTAPGQHFGLIAEQIATLDPDLAGYDNDGAPTHVKYLEMVPFLIDIVQQQQKQLDQLKRRATPLKQRHYARTVMR